ncbi:MAG: IS701 family transposase [Phycisphaerales bacterium]|nr:MAG: IS701 family transposase [Phycisphaerales bacterium]
MPARVSWGFGGGLSEGQGRRYLDLYVEGQLSDLPRKSIGPMADAVGEPPRNLQQFLSLFRWDEQDVRDRAQQHVARRHSQPHSVGVFDETSFLKKGEKTACVQRQHCGAVGKLENCVVSVHLGYATPEFYTLLDGELYLPEETWHEDRQRCREAGIGDDVVYRPKWRIALEQYHRAVGNGVRFAWLTFDEYYGRNGHFLRELDPLGQDYVAEVPVNFMAWTRRPQVLYRRHQTDKRTGRRKRYPRLKVKNNPRVEVKNILRYSPAMRRLKWHDYYVKDGSKGPMVWQVKHITVYLADEHGLPGRPYHLLVARSALDHEQVKYFISNAPPGTSTEILLRVAFTRWIIERAFEDGKNELGMDHFEVRKFCSIQRHLILSCLSHLFLSEFCLKYRGKKPADDRMSGSHGRRAALSDLVSRRALFPQVRRADSCAIGVNATAKQQGRSQPSTPDNQAITRDRHKTKGRKKMSLELLVAL